MEDIATVWSWEAFLSAFAWGMIFGVTTTFISNRHAQWRSPASVRAQAWLGGLLTAAFLMGLSLSQVAAALWNDDPSWVRILSRAIGPNLMAAIGVGVGIYVANRLSNPKEGRDGRQEGR